MLCRVMRMSVQQAASLCKIFFKTLLTLQLISLFYLLLFTQSQHTVTILFITLFYLLRGLIRIFKLKNCSSSTPQPTIYAHYGKIMNHYETHYTQLHPTPPNLKVFPDSILCPPFVTFKGTRGLKHCGGEF